ncbi:hypothetical protein J6590_065246 [Homalodisca vitripennis]|nr:hypothetical protein J6590_065246 [Homalodisca vitripennis]
MFGSNSCVSTTGQPGGGGKVVSSHHFSLQLTDTCTRGCYNGGVCVGPDLCECPVNATGPTCSQPLCDPPCENGAACGPGNTCLCGPHTTGTRCQTRNCDYRFVQEPYTRGFRKLVKKRVETKCGVKTCFRTLAEYHTVYKTFYRTVYKCAGD